MIDKTEQKIINKMKSQYTQMDHMHHRGLRIDVLCYNDFLRHLEMDVILT